MRIDIDLDGFSVAEHRELRELIVEICPGAAVGETDARRSRHIDGTTIAMAMGIVSAVCAVCSLVLQGLQLRQGSLAANADDNLDHLIAYAETRLSITLPDHVKVEIRQKLVGRVPPITVEIISAEYSYCVSILGTKSTYSITGRLKRLVGDDV
jgi:hypothetical protein